MRLSADPTHTGPLLEAVGVEGVGLTTTVVEPAELVQPLAVTVTLYVPAAANVTLAIVGFCKTEVNPLGPVQAYVAPETAGVVRLSADPTHTGPLLDAVGVAGEELTTRVVDPAALVHPLTVTVTLYVPAAANVTLAIVGFCNEEVKPFGPVHAYVAPETAGVVRFNADPTHKGPLLAAVGVAGDGLTTRVVEPAALVHPPTVTVTLYVPASANVTPDTEGVRDAEVKPLGPVQAYVAPATTGVERLSVTPAHNGPLLVAAGVAGTGLTTTVVEPAALVHPPTVTVTLYVPASASVTLAIDGFCTAAVKPLGPVQS